MQYILLICTLSVNWFIKNNDFLLHIHSCHGSVLQGTTRCGMSKINIIYNRELVIIYCLLPYFLIFLIKGFILRLSYNNLMPPALSQKVQAVAFPHKSLRTVSFLSILLWAEISHTSHIQPFHRHIVS